MFFVGGREAGEGIAVCEGARQDLQHGWVAVAAEKDAAEVVESGAELPHARLLAQFAGARIVDEVETTVGKLLGGLADGMNLLPVDSVVEMDGVV